jgi:hypothetical protein
VLQPLFTVQAQAIGEIQAADRISIDEPTVSGSLNYPVVTA